MAQIPIGCAFEIDADVVCITDNWPRRFGPKFAGGPTPQLGRIYRVTGMVMSSQLPNSKILPQDVENHLLLKLAEIPESWNSARGFRRVPERDISLFKTLLDPAAKPGTVTIDEKKIGDVKGLHD